MSIRGGKLQVALGQAERSARLTIQSENGDTANCLRARASLNATDNTIMEYAKEEPIEPYETFNWHDSEAFAKGSFGGGISHTIKCGNYIAILEVVYEDDNTA